MLKSDNSKIEREKQVDQRFLEQQPLFRLKSKLSPEEISRIWSVVSGNNNIEEIINLVPTLLSVEIPKPKKLCNT